MSASTRRGRVRRTTGRTNNDLPVRLYKKDIDASLENLNIVEKDGKTAARQSSKQLQRKKIRAPPPSRHSNFDRDRTPAAKDRRPGTSHVAGRGSNSDARSAIKERTTARRLGTADPRKEQGQCRRTYELLTHKDAETRAKRMIVKRYSLWDLSGYDAEKESEEAEGEPWLPGGVRTVSARSLRLRDGKESSTKAVDINNDGVIDEEELRLAEAISNSSQWKYGAGHGTAGRARRGARSSSGMQIDRENTIEAELKKKGRTLMCRQFVSANADRLDLLGPDFEGKTKAEALEYLLSQHPTQFPVIFDGLRRVERQLNLSDSSKMRVSLAPDKKNYIWGSDNRLDREDEKSQTWVDVSVSLTPRMASSPCERQRMTKVAELRAKRSRRPTATSIALPSEIQSITADSSTEVQGDKLKGSFPASPTELQPRKNDAFSKQFLEGVRNGCIDVDGDGLIDEMEIRLSWKLKQAMEEIPPHIGEANQEDWLQSQGRQFMAEDFIESNHENMGRFDTRYRGLSKEQMVERLTSEPHFATVMNNLRAKERIYGLTSSKAVEETMTSSPPPSRLTTRQRRLQANRKKEFLFSPKTDPTSGAVRDCASVKKEFRQITSQIELEHIRRHYAKYALQGQVMALTNSGAPVDPSAAFSSSGSNTKMT